MKLRKVSSAPANLALMSHQKKKVSIISDPSLHCVLDGEVEEENEKADKELDMRNTKEWIKNDTNDAFRKELFSLMGNALPYSNDDQKLIIDIVSDGFDFSWSFVSRIVVRFGVHVVSSLIIQKIMQGVVFVQDNLSLH